MREAILWEPMEKGAVRCNLCSFRCRITPGRLGICGVRQNLEGRLYTLNYDRVVSRAVDPIEKKPLYHFLPGSTSYSVSTVGCNFRCLHCQNAEISQMRGPEIPGVALSPEAMARDAKANRCASISYTYTEPTVFAELALDTARLARDLGVRNAFVTNGYQTPELVDLMTGLIDAANVDLKFYRADLYRKVCGGPKLDRILKSIELMHERGIWIEITTLVIPDLNVDDLQLRGIARFIARLSRDIPWHVTAFFPTYRLHDRPPTGPDALERAREIGLEEGLHFVYCGNIRTRGGQDTACPGCGRILVRRGRMACLSLETTSDGRCPQCGAILPGVGMANVDAPR